MDIMNYGGIIFIILYMAVLIGLGIWGQRKTTEDMHDYYVAKGTISTPLAFLVALGTGFSSFTFVGAVGLAYDLGLDGVILAGGCLVMATPGVVLLGKRIWALGKKYGYITPADLLADRYDSKTMRLLVAFICVAFSFFYISVQLVGMAHIINILTNNAVSYQLAVVIMALVLGFYVSVGGMRAVAYTDALQSILLVVGMVFIFGFAYIQASNGAMATAVDNAPYVYQLQLSPLYLWSLSFGYGLSIAVWPQYYVRYFSTKRLSGVFSVGMANDLGCIFLLTIFAGLIGYTGIALFPGVAPDTVTVRFITIMPVFLAWPLCAAAAAAAQSTADALILLCGSIYAKDIHVSFLQPKATQRQLHIVSQVVTIAIVATSILAALNPPQSLLKVVLDMAFPGYFLLFPVTVAALYWRRATTQGAIAALVVGLITLVFTIFVWPDALNIYSGVWGFVTSSITLVIVSKLTPPPPSATIERIHDYLDQVDYKSLQNG